MSDGPVRFAHSVFLCFAISLLSGCATFRPGPLVQLERSSGETAWKVLIQSDGTYKQWIKFKDHECENDARLTPEALQVVKQLVAQSRSAPEMIGPADLDDAEVRVLPDEPIGRIEIIGEKTINIVAPERAAVSPPIELLTYARTHILPCY